MVSAISRYCTAAVSVYTGACSWFIRPNKLSNHLATSNNWQFIQGRRHRCGRCGHGRTTFSLNQFFFLRGQRAHRFVLVRYWIGKYVRTHVVRYEGFGDHLAFPSRSFGKSAPVNRSFQVTIWVLMAPNSISEHANFKKILGAHAPRPP